MIEKGAIIRVSFMHLIQLMCNFYCTFVLSLYSAVSNQT